MIGYLLNVLFAMIPAIGLSVFFHKKGKSISIAWIIIFAFVYMLILQAAFELMGYPAQQARAIVGLAVVWSGGLLWVSGRMGKLRANETAIVRAREIVPERHKRTKWPAPGSASFWIISLWIIGLVTIESFWGYYTMTAFYGIAAQDTAAAIAMAFGAASPVLLTTGIVGGLVYVFSKNWKAAMVTWTILALIASLWITMVNVNVAQYL